VAPPRPRHDQDSPKYGHCSMLGLNATRGSGCSKSTILFILMRLLLVLIRFRQSFCRCFQVDISSAALSTRDHTPLRVCDAIPPSNPKRDLLKVQNYIGEPCSQIIQSRQFVFISHAVHLFDVIASACVAIHGSLTWLHVQAPSLSPRGMGGGGHYNVRSLS